MAERKPVYIGTDGNPTEYGATDTIPAANVPGATAVIDPGVLWMFGGSAAPTGWLLCDGAAVNRTTYADLFAVIGTAYGPGNGTTTFNLPDLQGRMPIGAGSGAGLTARAIGDNGGAETHTLTEAQLPAHTHPAQVVEDSDAYGGATGKPSTSSTWAGTTSATQSDWSTAASDLTLRSTAIGDTGSGTAHNNMPPFLAVNFIIKT